MTDVSKAKIERLSLSELNTLCGRNGLSTAGTRFELAIRLATHLFPEQAAQPLPTPAIGEAWLCLLVFSLLTCTLFVPSVRVQ